MNDREQRVNKVHSTIASKACLDSQEEDEEFFSASDGENCPPSPSPPSESPLKKEVNNSSTIIGPCTSTSTAATGLIAAGDATNAGDGRQRSVVGCRLLPGGSVEHAAPRTEMGGQESHRVSETITVGARPRAICATNSSERISNGIAASKDDGVLDRATRRRGHEGTKESGTELGSLEEQDRRSSSPGTAGHEGAIDAVGGEERAASTPMAHSGVFAIASFAAISVSDLRMRVHEDLGGIDRQSFVRVRDQHGNQRQTAPRAFAKATSVQQDDGGKLLKQSCTMWCQELKIPILPDVEGVLFELLLLATPSGTSEGCFGPQPTDVMGNRNPQQDVNPNPSALESTSARSGPEKSSPDGGVSLKSVRGRDSRACMLVGAVALLLSEVVDTWRTMESPLFDSAGGVVGKIKLAARVSGLEIRDTQETSRVQDAVEREITHEVVKENSTAQVKGVQTVRVPGRVETVAVAAASPGKPVRPARVMSSIEQNPESSPQQKVKTRAGGRNHKQGLTDTSGSRCRTCTRGRDSKVAYAHSSHGGEHCNDGTRPGVFPSTVAAAAVASEGTAGEDGSSSIVKAEAMTPRVVVLYRGVRLPFRWFRSGTVRGMEIALRETLGILDDSVPLPLLYDTGTGNRVTLHPGIPSGRILLAAFEGCSSSQKEGLSGGVGLAGKSKETYLNRGAHRDTYNREHGLLHHHRRYRRRRRDRADAIELCGKSFSPRPTLNSRANLNSLPLRRVVSAENLRCLSPVAAPETTCANAGLQANAGFLSSGPRTTDSTDPVVLGETGDFAQEVQRPQLQLRRAREEHELRETRRQREAHQLNAKAVACQLACRVVCRSHRIRILAAALWRWKAQATHLKLEQDGWEKQNKNDEQAVALLDGLRQQVETLTASTKEALLKVSIDALERDFINGKETDHRADADRSVGGFTRRGEEKDLVGRGVTELRAGIARLSKLREEKAELQENRMREARNIEEAVARNATGDMHPVSTPPAELDTTWLKQGSKICASPKAQDHGKDRRRDASIGDNEQASHHRAPIPSDWEGATKCETSANRDEKDQKGQQEASTCVQDKIWSEDDVILDGFLTQHAADMRRPGGGIDQRRPCPSRGKGHDGERVEVEDGALRSEGGLKLMWALFRVFSESRSPPRTNPLSRPSIAVRETNAVDEPFLDRPRRRPEALTQAGPEVGHDGITDEGVSLLAFLGLCRRAGLVLPTALGASSFTRGDGMARYVPRDRFWRARQRYGCCGGQEGCCCEAGGRGCTLGQPRGVIESTAPREKYFLLDPADAAGVFARIVRRYGSVTAIADHRADGCSPYREGTDVFGARDGTHWNGGDSRAMPSFSPRRRRTPANTAGTGHACSDSRDGSAAHRGGKNIAMCRHHYQGGVESPRGCRRNTTDDEGLRFHDESKMSLDGHQRQPSRHQQSGQGDRNNSRTPRWWQHNRPFRSNCGGRLGCTPSSSEGLLDFGQFIEAMEGVVELLTVGCDGHGGDLSGGACGEGGVRAGMNSGGTGVGVGIGGGGGSRDEDCGLGYGDGARPPQVMTMTPELAQARVVRLAKDVAVEQLVSRDRRATEMLALLDPSLQSALDVNQEVLREIFAFYSHKHARRPSSTCRNHAHPHSSNNNADAVGSATRSGRVGGGDGSGSGSGDIAAAHGGGSGHVRTGQGPQVTVLGMTSEGGQAFVADFGLAPLVADSQQLGELWTVACLHQLERRQDRSNLAAKQRVEAPGNNFQTKKEEAGNAPPESNILFFSGFLDFLGWFAVRHVQKRTEIDGRVEQQGAASMFGGTRLPSPCSSLFHPARGPAKSKHKSILYSSTEQRPGQSMLAVLSLMDASGGCLRIARCSGAEGCSGSLRRVVLRRGFRLPPFE